MITSLELPNFGHMTTFTLWFESRDKILLVINERNYDAITFFLKKNFILRRSGVAIFAGIIKIVTIFIKTILKDSRKVRRIRNYVSK